MHKQSVRFYFWDMAEVVLEIKKTAPLAQALHARIAVESEVHIARLLPSTLR